MPPAGACTEGKVQFETDKPINVPAGSTAISFGVDVATENCLDNPFVPGVSWIRFAPLLRFRLISITDPQVTEDIGGEIDPCTDPGAPTHPAQEIDVPLPLPVRRNGAAPGSPPWTPDPTWKITARVGTYRLTTPVPPGWSSFYLEMINNQANGWGNDSAIDNIEVLDATPQLTKSFSPASLPAGQATTLTFTVDNTNDLDPKSAWSFTDTLPSGMKVADPADLVVDCPGVIVTVTAPSGASPPGTITPGATSIDVSGPGLMAGQATCTVSVNVTAEFAGPYENTQGNIHPYEGILVPTQTADVEFTGGTLCFTVWPATKTLPAVTPGGVTADDLGTVTVADERNLASAGWTVTVTSTDFTTGAASPAETIPASAATYTAGPVDPTGNVTITYVAPPFALSNPPDAKDVLTATGSGVNTASWDPRISVTVPASAVTGTYTATITHSVF